MLIEIFKTGYGENLKNFLLRGATFEAKCWQAQDLPV